MTKRVFAFSLVLLLLLSFENTVLACDENQTNTYILQILFGDSALKKTSDENVKMLLSALYLCSIQSDNQGDDEINYLKRRKVPGISDLSDLNIDGTKLMECSHNSWEYEFTEAGKQQENRKKVLQNTVNKIFDFGLLNNWLGSKSGKCNSFAALLYYSHILTDYLADQPIETKVNIKGKEVPSYAGKDAVILNGGKPLFTKEQKDSTESVKKFSPLDSQGRTGVVFANIGSDTLRSVGGRETTSAIKPSGWNQSKYEGLINSPMPYLFNRCHLLSHQLGGSEEDTNLITGTRYLNEAMMPYEKQIGKYIENTGNHVLYQVTPVFKRDNKLASGVQLEAYSVEDSGQGLCFNVYCYNVQPGVEINYMNGESDRADDIIGREDVLPFVVKEPNENNPDLLYEMNTHLKVLFDSPENKNTYNKMIIDGIKPIAKEARDLDDQENIAKYYKELKKLEYDYLEVLKSYIPRLLEKEEFFNLL